MRIGRPSVAKPMTHEPVNACLLHRVTEAVENVGERLASEWAVAIGDEHMAVTSGRFAPVFDIRIERNGCDGIEDHLPLSAALRCLGTHGEYALLKVDVGQ